MHSKTAALDPVRSGNTWLFADGTRLPVVSGGDGPLEQPSIPDDLSALSDDDLGALRTSLRDYVASLKDKVVLTTEDTAFVNAAREAVEAIKATLAERADAAAAIDAVLDDEGDDAGGEGDDEGDDDDDADDDLADAGEPDGDAGDDGSDEDEPAAVTASAAAPARRRPSAAAVADAAPASTTPPATPDAQAQAWKSHMRVKGYAAGDNFGSMTDMADVLVDTYKQIRGGSTDKIVVAELEGRFADNAKVEPGKFAPFDPFNPESVRAGLDCVPREPVYDVGCASSTERPFANSLPNKQTARGGFSVYSSPMLADLTNDDGGDGTGIWTRADDANDSDAVKEACAIVPCGDSENYDIYGVYRCITVRNLLQMTFPELVAAYLNKLGAAWARLAEVTLLDAAINSANVTDVTADATENIGATSNLLDKLLQVACVYTEQERYADGLTWGVWLPRWVLTLIIRDQLFAPRYNPTFEELVVTRAQVNAAFRRAGFNVHWTMDSASTWESIGTQEAGPLEELPTQVDMLIALEGNFQRLDKGTLTVGVTNRNPWDKDDMARNQFTMFWESFEGIYDAGCPSYTLSIGPLCPNGLMYFEPQAAAECVAEGS